MKLKKKNCAIALIILFVLLFEFANPFELIATHSIKNLNYSSETAKILVKYGLKDEVLDHEYNKFIDVNAKSKDFNIKNYDLYKDLIYYDDFHDISIVNLLIEKGYNVDEINCILNTGDYESAKEFLEREKYDHIVDFLNFDYAHLSKLDRYIEYQKETISDYDDTVLHVEIGLDNDFYTEYNDVTEFSYDMLVNKYNRLDENFVPNDLIKVDSKYSASNDNYGNKVMLDNFYKMADDMNKAINLSIYVRSGYRTYKSQVEVYDEYLALYGKSYVAKYVAYPGFSEHQTGLSVDIKASSSEVFANTKESKWLQENAYKYGFILRYSKSLEDITGYQNEAWHYRYVGVDIATYIHNNKMSFDEYYVKFLSE